MFIQVIGSVSNGFYPIRLYFESVIFWVRTTTGHTRVRSVSHSSVERSVIQAIGLASVLVSVEVRVECEVSSFHRLIIGLVLPSTDQVRVFFFSSRIWLQITNYYRSSQYQIKSLVIFWLMIRFPLLKEK